MIATFVLGSAIASNPDKDKRAVEVAFADFQARSAAFDASVAEMYADDAQISTTRDGRDLTMTGRDLKAVLRQAMDVARARGDTDTYTSIVVAPHDDGQWRVTAVRSNSLKCSTDKGYHADFGRFGKRWLIVAEHSTTSSKSECPPDPKLPTRLAEMRAQIQPMLPLTLDEETVLESVETDATSITYGMRLPNVAAGELTPLKEALRGSMLGSVCAEPTARAVLDAGATFRYRWTNAANEVAEQEAVSGDCP